MHSFCNVDVASGLTKYTDMSYMKWSCIVVWVSESQFKGNTRVYLLLKLSLKTTFRIVNTTDLTRVISDIINCKEWKLTMCSTVVKYESTDNKY